MNSKTKNIFNWVLTGLVALVFLGSAMGKLSANEEAVAMAKSFGASLEDLKILAIIEIASVLLFVIPRTGLLGTLLLSAYMGGAISAHFTHQLSIAAPAIILAFIWIIAVVRFPELLQRIAAKK